MFYRISQFIRAFFPNIDTSEIKWAVNYLSPEACSLFFKQSRPEQRHALDVATSLIKDQHKLTQSDFQNLLTAALLHDCGKSIVSISLWQRVFIVLMQKMPEALWSNLQQGPNFLALPLKIATKHALLGSHLARKAGLNPTICRLIREHHNPQTDLGRKLERADNMN